MGIGLTTTFAPGRLESRRRLRVGEVGLLVCAALVLSILLSSSLVYGWLAYGLGGVIALVWIVLVMDRPWVGVATLVLITSSFISQDSLPFIRIGGNFRPTDLILGFLLFLVLTRPAVNAELDLVHTPMDLPLLLWTGAAVVACVTAAQFGVRLLSAIPEARNILYYLAFFAVTNLVRDRASLKWLVIALFAMAVLTSFALMVQAAVGTSVHLIPGFVYEVTVGSEDFAGVSRVEAPGSILIQCLAVGAFAAWMLRRVPISFPVYAAMLGVLLVADILPFYRSLWISLLIPLALAFVFVPPARKARILFSGLVILALLLGLMSLLMSMDNKLGAYGRALVARGGSLATMNAFTNQEDTWTNRIGEVRDAIPVVQEHPLEGIGFANPWRTGWRFLNDVGTFTHNGYLWILVKMGLVGLVPFLWMTGLYIFRGVSQWRQVRHPFYQALSLGFALAFLGLLVANVAEPRFTENWKWTTALAVVMGINEVIYRLYGPQATESLSSEADLG